MPQKGWRSSTQTAVPGCPAFALESSKPDRSRLMRSQLYWSENLYVADHRCSAISVYGYSGEGEHRFRKEAERRSGAKVNSSRSEATLAW